MAMLYPVTAFVVGILAAAVVSLHQLEVVSAMYMCPPAMTILGDMQPCMPAVEGSYPDPPDEKCCYVVRTTEPSCLCMAFAGYKNSASINLKATMNLPHLCGRAVATNFSCNGVRVPVAGMPSSRKLMP